MHALVVRITVTRVITPGSSLKITTFGCFSYFCNKLLQRLHSWVVVNLHQIIHLYIKHWFVSRTLQNKLKHFLNGNQGHSNAWYRQHVHHASHFLSVATLNTGREACQSRYTVSIYSLARLCNLTWSLTSIDRNRLMHILHGNHGHSKSWYRQHPHNNEAYFSFATLNIGGLQEAVKRTRIKELNKDIVVLTETHLQDHLAHSENHQFKDFYCSWGTNPSDKHFRGIGILVKRSSFWSVKQVVWPSDHPCHRFAQDSRLVATQVWCARGGTSFVVYGVYGVSGARWDRVKKTYTHELIKAIQFDQISRGQMPYLIMGDFNLELQDSQVLRELLQKKFWYDVRSRGIQSETEKATCHKSSGSKIDHIFVSPSLIDQCYHFQICKFPEFKDHSLVAAKRTCPSSVQTRTSLRSVAALPQLKAAEVEDSLIPCSLAEPFDKALTEQDVDCAFKLWAQEFERVLFEISKQQGHPVTGAAAAKRGQILFHEQRKHPKIVNQQASTLKGRKL